MIVRFFIPLLVFVSACQSQQKPAETLLVEGDINLTETLTANRYSNIYFSGQPSANDWGKLKQLGFTHVVNLRTRPEYDEPKEREALQGLGVVYSHIPVDMKQKFTVDKMNEVTQAIVKHRPLGKTLVHCSSGNRAAYWAGAHFHSDHKYSEDKSYDLAKKMGLTKEALQLRLKKDLEQSF